MSIKTALYWHTIINGQPYYGKIKQSDQVLLKAWAYKHHIKINCTQYPLFCWPLTDDQLNQKHLQLLKQLEPFMQHMHLLQDALVLLERMTYCPWRCSMLLLIQTHLKQGDGLIIKKAQLNYFHHIQFGLF